MVNSSSIAPASHRRRVTASRLQSRVASRRVASRRRVVLTLFFPPAAALWTQRHELCQDRGTGAAPGTSGRVGIGNTHFAVVEFVSHWTRTRCIASTGDAVEHAQDASHPADTKEPKNLRELGPLHVSWGGGTSVLVLFFCRQGQNYETGSVCVCVRVSGRVRGSQRDMCVFASM